ncbi:Hypothetical_protein [Hexamita inflata]|uniref:Hypothetical_protein n=1 Tax=Hexamita inflata TaxID=28002 RepID=A0AA86PV09_9EUKA|nr:Hypothetical protein HINF_LOCUS32307 [Hexamita inflata]
MLSIVISYCQSNNCTDEYCCRIYDSASHFINGSCLICSEFYDYNTKQCKTCQDQYGTGSYYSNNNCLCAPGMSGYNSVCTDCWTLQKVVSNYKCVDCSIFDKLAIYQDQNCICSNNESINGGCSKQEQSNNTQLYYIIVIVVIFLLLGILTMIFILKKRKQLNMVEFGNKQNQKRRALDIEQKEELNQNGDNNLSTGSVQISDNIENMLQVLQDIDTTHPQILESEVQLYDHQQNSV